jgi:hypothetical protein
MGVHADLVAVAERWLRKAERCGVVLTECDGTTAEIPDAIGWKCWGNVSILVECKVSRPDFLADRRKPFRQVGGLGVGRFRYYLAPGGLLKPADLPPGWGWLEWTGSRVMRRRKAIRRENNLFAENTMLARRMKLYQRVERGQGVNPTKSGRAVMSDLSLACGVPAMPGGMPMVTGAGGGGDRGGRGGGTRLTINRAYLEV